MFFCSKINFGDFEEFSSRKENFFSFFRFVKSRRKRQFSNKIENRHLKKIFLKRNWAAGFLISVSSKNSSVYTKIFIQSASLFFTCPSNVILEIIES